MRIYRLDCGLSIKGIVRELPPALGVFIVEIVFLIDYVYLRGT